MIEKIFDEIAAAGYRVNNLFQMQPKDGEPGVWRANLSRNVTEGNLDDFTCFAVGEGPTEALAAAAAQMKKPKAAEEPDDNFGGMLD